MATGITSVEFKDLGPVNPAQTDRSTGEVWLNSRLIHKYPEKYWYYILKHEEGHIVGNNRSEFSADEYASRQFLAKYPNEPFTSVDALKNVLPMVNADQMKRVADQTSRAAKFDCAHNGNKNSCAMVQPNKSNYSGVGIAKNPNESIGINDITIIELLQNVRSKKRYSLSTMPAEVFEDTYKAKPKNGAQFIAMLKKLNGISNYSNFLEGSGCKKWEFACITAETNRKKAEEETAQAQLAADSLAQASNLDYQKTLLTLTALYGAQKSQEELAKLAYDLELKKLDAAKKAPLDSKKLAVVGLIAAAALLIIFFVTGDTKPTA